MTTATTRRDSSFRYIQQRVPVDIDESVYGRVYPITLPACGSTPEQLVQITIRPVIKLSLRVRDSVAAKLRNAAVYEQLMKIFDSLREKPQELSHKQAVGLSRDLYDLVVDRFDDNPGEPGMWEAWKAFTWAAVEGRIPNPPSISWRKIVDERKDALGHFGVSSGPRLLDEIDRLAEGNSEHSLEVRFGFIATWIFTRRGMEVTPRSRILLLRQLAEAAFKAGWRMKRAAKGDYAPDPEEKTFPQVDATVSQGSITVSSLFERWCAEREPAVSTRINWQFSINDFCKCIKNPIAKDVTKKDVIRWKDSLIFKKLSVRTINDNYLASLKTILSYGVQNELLSQNVASGVKILHKGRAGVKQLPYDDNEVAKLLEICVTETIAARRWIPLLEACSGARAGELAQLWAERVREVDGVTVMELRPAEDGGSFKNEGSEREVPLHPALIDAGFLAFVRDKGRGPLFYGRATGNGVRHPSKGTVNHLAAWIRKQDGFDNPRKKPNHAFRHWWKSTASRVGILDSRANAIQGHATPGEAAGYRHFDRRGFAVDVAKIPIPRF